MAKNPNAVELGRDTDIRVTTTIDETLMSFIGSTDPADATVRGVQTIATIADALKFGDAGETNPGVHRFDAINVPQAGGVTVDGTALAQGIYYWDKSTRGGDLDVSQLIVLNTATPLTTVWGQDVVFNSITVRPQSKEEVEYDNLTAISKLEPDFTDNGGLDMEFGFNPTFTPPPDRGDVVVTFPFRLSLPTGQSIVTRATLEGRGFFTERDNAEASGRTAVITQSASMSWNRRPYFFEAESA